MIGSALALLLAASAATASPPPTQSGPPVTATAVASRPEPTIGEVFTIEVRASGPAGTTYTFPGDASDDTFELSSVPEEKAAAPGVHRYQAAVFALGEAQIPPIPVRYRLPDGTQGETATAPLTLRVVSLLPKDPQQQKLADVRGPLQVSIGRAFWIAAGLALLLVAALVAWVVRRRRRRGAPAVAPVPVLSAEAEALQALEVLSASDLLSRGEYRGFYIGLTAIAKRYLERQLSAPVVEMTTAETLAFLRAHPAGGELLPVVRDLAEAADRIKFAKGEGLAREAERHLASVRALVPALEARLRPPQPQAEGKAA